MINKLNKNLYINNKFKNLNNIMNNNRLIIYKEN